jgi:hypothetical protein
MIKPVLPRITEPAEGPDMVHYASPWGMDQVTLCGKTDFIGEPEGTPTRKAVTCQPCRWIVDYIRAHR